MSLWARVKSPFRRPSAAPAYDIRLSAEGFSLIPTQRRDREVHVSWAEVTRIRTYKLDLFAVDCICLLFERASAEPVEVVEEWHGFVDLMGALRDRFPSIPADWYVTVMSPAFERNEAVLYDRSNVSATA